MQTVILHRVLYVFLKSHNEAYFEPCCKSALLIIQLRGKLQCKTNGFHKFDIEIKSDELRSGVAVCSFKCMHVLFRMSFSIGKLIFRNDKLLSFDSHSC